MASSLRCTKIEPNRMMGDETVFYLEKIRFVKFFAKGSKILSTAVSKIDRSLSLRAQELEKKYPQTIVFAD